MRICQISTAHLLNDNRIFHKISKSLARVGHEVFLVIKHDRDEIIDGVHIIGLPQPKGRLGRMFFLTFKALFISLRLKADVYHFHDPELVPAGLVLKLLGNIVIYDVHENVTQQVLNKDWLGYIWMRKLISFAVRFVEMISKKAFDVIITARPDIAEHWNCSKTRVILNSAVLETIDNAPEVSIEKKKPVVIYAGGLAKVRGIKELIEAMEIVGGLAELWLLGSWQVEGFQEECERLPGWKHVKYLGYMNVEQVFSHMKKSDIGIVTFLRAPNHLTTIPTKPFEYMACHLPVIMSDFDYWQEIFGDNAVFADPASPVEIAQKIKFLLGNKDFVARLAGKGRELVESKYSWEFEQVKLLGIYDELRKRLQ